MKQRNNGAARLEELAEPASSEVRLYAQLGLRLPAELALRLKRYCHESGKSANRAVMEALVQYLETKRTRPRDETSAAGHQG